MDIDDPYLPILNSFSDEEKTSPPSSAPLIIPKDEEQDNTDSQSGGNEAEVQYPGVVSEYDGVNCTIVNENEDEGQTEVMISKQIDFNADQDSEEDPTLYVQSFCSPAHYHLSHGSHSYLHFSLVRFVIYWSVNIGKNTKEEFMSNYKRKSNRLDKMHLFVYCLG